MMASRGAVGVDFAALVAEGVFGADWSLADAKVAPIGGLGQDHWASTTLQATLELRSRSGDEQRTEAVVAKCMVPNDGFEGYSLADAQAENEDNMYTKVIPLFSRLCAESDLRFDQTPKCFLARSGPSAPAELLSLTVLEDLRPQGFRLAKERTGLDKQHVMLALRSLGHFHAASYAAKARCRDEFMALAGLLRECNYVPETRPRYNGILQQPVQRGLRRLASRLEQDQERLEKFRRLEARLEQPFDVMVGALACSESTAVIVHGDFCRNNMLFRYDAKTGQPVDVRLFDFQNSRYCSPAVDLSFFLFLNTSSSLRAAHWDDLLEEYFDSLQTTLRGLLKGYEPPKDFVMPSMKAVREDLKQNALWGYVICSFFLPQMMLPPEEMPNFEEMTELSANNPQAAVDLMLSLGGEPATNALADILLECLNRDLIP